MAGELVVRAWTRMLVRAPHALMNFRTGLRVASVVCVLGIATPAFAEQAEWIDATSDERAIALLRTARAVRFYCALCGDSRSEWVAIESLSMVQAPDDLSVHNQIPGAKPATATATVSAAAPATASALRRDEPKDPLTSNRGAVAQ